MQSVPGLRELQPVSLSDLDPSRTPAGEITAVVSLVWPYSSSALRLTAIIAHQEHRRRERRGELKVLFTGYAAESLRKLAIGEVVKLSLEGADWEPLPDTQEKDVPWQLRWEKRLRVKVFKDSSATEPYIDVDRTFDEAQLSGVFERIAAAEAIISESQREQPDDFASQTPQKPSTQLSGSWSASFFGSQQTPINIFAQGRRRLFNTDSDEDDEGVEAERPSKRPRLFEPHQSFRYVSGSPHDEEDEDAAATQQTQRAEDQFFDENSFRTSFRTANESGLYVRPDDAADVSMDGESSFRTALADRSQSSKMYIRPDDSQDKDGRKSKTPETTNVLGDTDTQDTIRETSREDSTSSDLYKIFFGHSPKSYSPTPVPPEPSGAALDADSNRPLGRLLSTQESDASSRVPLAPKGGSSGKVSPVPLQERLSPPEPAPPRGIEVDSQPMSSFTLDAERSRVASQSAAGPRMPPPPLQTRRVPPLDTTSLQLREPITPTLKPAASPALPLPSPFPTSALGTGSLSFFPSQSTQGTLRSTESNVRGEPASGTLSAASGTARAALQQMEDDIPIERQVEGKERTQPTPESPRVLRAGERSQVARETITVVKRPSTATSEVSGSHTRITVEDIFIRREDPSQARPTAPEVITILDSSDDEDDDAEAGAISDEDEEYAEVESEEESLEDTAESNFRAGYIVASDEDVEDSEDDQYDQGHRLEEVIEYAEMEEFEYVRHSTPAGEEENRWREEDEEEEVFGIEEEEEEDGNEERAEDSAAEDASEADDLQEAETEEAASPSKVGSTLVPAAPSPFSHISPSYRARADRNQDQTPEASASASPTSTRGYPEARSTDGLRGLVMSILQDLSESSTPTGTPSSQRDRHSGAGPGRLPSVSTSQENTPFARQKMPQHEAVKDVDIVMGDADDTGTPQPRGRRTLPWKTPRQRVPEHSPYAGLPLTEPQLARIRPPLSPPRTEPARKPADVIFGNGQGKAKQSASEGQSVARAEAETEAEEVRRLREYNTKANVPAGTVTSLSEFVPLGRLHRLPWDATVDVLAVNLRDATAEQMEKPPKFFHMTLVVIDPSCADGKGVIVRLLRPYKEGLPANVKQGDILLLRNIRFKSTNHRRSGGSTMSSGWKVWRPRRAPDGTQELVEIPNGGPYVEVGAGEVAYANQLWEWWKGIDVDVRVYLIHGTDMHTGPQGGTGQEMRSF
ncbi:hypothetical protein Dda_8502 [Drechslerella dactyloides]|uniref:Telomeric single stranded DNA binding POT1/Cdc13 domain-containing protein n=1 Tax=Drechslerella dactyloides TaxID=74499 RepID=A0AAD6IQR6_DREDA|nr:hypothetical protein Dda_8502 [Drechslerella dactyloides]